MQWEGRAGGEGRRGWERAGQARERRAKNADGGEGREKCSERRNGIRQRGQGIKKGGKGIGQGVRKDN